MIQANALNYRSWLKGNAAKNDFTVTDEQPTKNGELMIHTGKLLVSK